MQLQEDTRVVELRHKQLFLDNHQQEDFDACLWCTQAAAPGWLKTTSSGLPLGVPEVHFLHHHIFAVVVMILQMRGS